MKYVGMATALLLLLACAPQKPRVDITSRPGTDLAAYRTFNFIEPLALDESGYPAVYGEAFRRQISAALTVRGYRLANPPDLVINIAATAPGEAAAHLENDPYQTIHPQQGTFYSGWRGYGQGYGSSTRVSRYSEGAFSVGLVDLARQDLVWEGVAHGRLSVQRSETEVEELVTTVVEELFREFPERFDERP